MPENSLSLILYVQDAESRLCDQVHCLLDVLSDFTNRFEIIVIDDGSLDDTYATACELARCFPQIRTARHSTPLGESGALRTAMEISTADILIVQDHNRPIRVQELQQLWELRNDPYLLMAHPQVVMETPLDSSQGRLRLDAYHHTVMNGAATRLLRRQAIQQLGSVSGLGQRLVVDRPDERSTRHHSHAPVRVRMMPLAKSN